MKTRFVVLASLTGCLLAIPSAFGEDIYVAQQALGNNSGSSALNAHSIAWLNTSLNWGAGSDKVGPGDTVHLCGTITSTLGLLGSGSPGAPITIFFEPGAKFSAPTWPDKDHGGGPIHSVGTRSWIVIDGGPGTNGLIECTDNGAGRTYSTSVWAIQFGNASDIVVRNLRFLNLYYREPGLDQGTSIGVALFGDQTNCYIQNCLIDMSGSGVVINYYNYSSNVVIAANTIRHINWGIFVNCYTAGKAYNFKVYGNNISHFERWDSGVSDIHHHDGIIVNADGDGVLNQGMRIYGNTFGPYMGFNCTAMVFSYPHDASEIQDMWIYNNLFLSYGTANDAPANGAINVWVSNALIANNTYVWLNSTPGSAFCGYGPGSRIYNNVCHRVTVGVNSAKTTPGDSDYNVWGGVTTMTQLGLYTSYSGWLSATTFDRHSKNTLASLDANYVPASNDTVARNSGKNLSAYFTTDFYGNPRPAGTTPWTIGAFETGPSSQPAPSVALSANPAIITNGQSSTLTWTSANATNVSISSIGTVALNGSTPVTPTSTVTYTATARGPGGTQTAVATVTVTVPTNTPPGTLPGTDAPIDTSKAAVTAPFVQTNGYIYQPGQTILSSSGRASFQFTVPEAAQYAVFAIVDAPSEAENSLFVNIDNEPQDPYMIWDIPVTTGFERRVCSWRGNGDADVSEFGTNYFNLAVGQHQLIIRGREGNVKITQVAIVKRPSPVSRVDSRQNLN